MKKLSSPYYPPRARWYGGVFKARDALWRRLAFDQVHLPYGISVMRLIGAFLVPGFGFWLRGPRKLGLAAMGACGLLLLLSLAWLGYFAGNAAFGLLLSIHSSAFVYLCEPWLTGVRFGERVLISLLALLLLGGLLYLPARHVIESRWLMPIRIHGKVVVVHRIQPGNALWGGTLARRGDWIAFFLPQSWNDGIYTVAGFGTGPIIALPGDEIRFSPASLEVNGVPRPLPANAPSAGSFRLPEKHWFVWPDAAIKGHGYSAERISAALTQMATVSEQQLIGKPFKRWFGRNQLPDL